MNHRVFISHASQDKEFVQKFLECYWGSVKLDQSPYFCTSLSGTLRAGEAFVPQIKKELETCTGVFFLMTKAYMQSPFCLAELGASWVLSQNILPILVSPIAAAEYDRTPLKGIQYIDLTSEHAVTEIWDVLKSWNIPVVSHTDFLRTGSLYSAYLDDYFVRSGPATKAGAITYLEPTEDGWYAAKVVGRRKKPSPKNNQQYTILKLDGFLPTNEELEQGETHWVMYQKDEYPDADTGDHIMFIDPQPRPLWRGHGEITRNFFISELRVIGKKIDGDGRE